MKMSKNKMLKYSSFNLWFLLTLSWVCNLANAVTPDAGFITTAFEYQASLVKNTMIEIQVYTKPESFNVELTNFQGATKYMKYIKEGDKEYLEQKNFNNGKLWFHSGDVFDGLQGKFLEYLPSKIGVIMNRKPTNFSNIPMPKTSEYLIWGKYFLTRLKEDNIQILPAQESIDGNICYVIEGSCNDISGASYKVWVDPNIGFMLRQLEIVAPHVKHISQLMNYTEVQPGLWFPMREHVESFEYNQVVTRNIYIVTSLKVNTIVPSETFSIEFPSGTRVYDEVAAFEYVVPDVTP